MKKEGVVKEENCIFPGWLTNRKRDQGVLAFLAEPAVDAVVSAKEKGKGRSASEIRGSH